MKFSLEELSKLVDGEPRGPSSLTVEGFSPLEEAKPGTIAYVESPKKIDEGEKSAASVLLIPASVRACSKPAIAVRNPKLAFARLLSLFHPEEEIGAGIDPLASVHPSASVGEHCFIGPFAVLEEGTKIGAGVRISALTFVGKRGVIGDGTRLHPGARILKDVRVGKNCVIRSGAVIGSEGFGYATDENGNHHPIPQTGTVVIEDNVEIGSNTTIDRATFGETRIERGTKIDNLVQVAHNCRIGENCLIAAMVGIAGSSTIGNGTVIGGQVGIKDHIVIGEKCIIAANAMIWGDLKPGSFVSGDPARPHRENLKFMASLSAVPGLIAKIRELEQEIIRIKRSPSAEKSK